MRVRTPVAIVFAVAGLAPAAFTLVSRAQERVDYERQIKPIFEQACYECHGADKGRGQLRLHKRALALKGGLSGPVILPNHGDDSLLVQRLLGLGDDDRMPLKKEPLSDAQIALVKAWIDQGAAWPETPAATDTTTANARPGDTRPAPTATTPATASATSAASASPAAPGHAAAQEDDAPRHWAYVKPQRPALPAVTRPDWIKTPIDQFILARLEQERLVPSHEASKGALLRRVSLDLIGLPPTLAELDAFTADTRPDAYERVVDRLLASPRFGERWARPWLDLARYADSNGYEKDNLRSTWKYRDWVIDALNADMPFDRFTIEQIAGDMLPDATSAQKVATGFHRNAMTNEEGGVDPDESLFDVLVDRVNTTSTVWLGSTIGCAQCHNHKYDPFSQKDYYRLMAFFQNTDYESKTFGDGTRYFEGKLDLATPEQETRRVALEKEIANREGALARKTPALAAAQTRWEQRLLQASADWTSLKPETVEATGEVILQIEPDGSISATGPNPAQTTYTIVSTTPLTQITGLRLEALPDPSLPKGGPGRDPYGHFRLTGITVDAEPANIVSLTAPSTRTARPVRSSARTATASRQALSARASSTSSARPSRSSPPEALVRATRDTDEPRAPSSARTTTTEGATPPTTFSHTSDPGTRQAQPVTFTQVRVDDAVEKLDGELFLARRPVATHTRTAWTVDAMRDETRLPRQAVLIPERPFGFASGTRLTIRLAHLDGTLGQGLGRFRLSVTGSTTPEQVISISARLRPALALPAARRSEKQAADLTAQFRRETPLLVRERDALKTSRQALDDLRLPTTLVMREKATFERPSTNLRERGAFNARGARLYAGVPPSLHPMPESQPMNRLGLARWLVAPDNPLTARVAVNRLWEQLFGRGLVETSEDFGTQGAPPSDQALLDWLATEFMEKQWSQKAMLRLMVLSAAYRQDARVTPALLERDPYNRLFARGPRFRLEGEMIRDAALTTAGLLSAKMHGPSVFPPQPDGVWNNPYSPEKWKTSEGEDRYRRGLYTFLRRTSPYPTMIALDATSREYCTVRRIRTNTPLQALALMNDEVFVEAARGLAARVMSEEGAGQTTDSRLTYAMRLTVAREPDTRELARLRTLFETQARYYAANPQDARQLVTPPAKVGASVPPAASEQARVTETTATGAKLMTDAEAAERAAWTIVSSVLLNLDETQTHE